MCNIITGAIRDLARQIGRSESYTCNLVSVWQTQNNSVSYPTAAQLNEILKSNKEQAWEIYLAVPNYEVREYNPNVVPIEHVNGQIYLMRLPKDKPMEHFYKMYKHLPELRELAVTPEEAYRFILWREMAFMQYGLDKKPKNRPVAEGEAIKKAREWRKRHPVTVQVEPKLSVEQGQQQSLSGHETKINIYAGTNENADLSNFATRPFDFREGYEDETSEAFQYFMDLHPLLPQEFNSVEQAFQAFKWAYALKDTDFAKEYVAGFDVDKSSESYKRGAKIFEVLGKILNSNNGAEIKKLGGTRGLLNQEDIKFWDEESSSIMKFLIKQSFKQNPQALQKLLATGNATLTHTQDKGKWGIEFPKLLMEVREELRQESGLTTPQVQPTTQQKATKSFSVEEATTTPAPQVITQEDINNVYKVPEIGSEVLRVDPNNSRAKLARDFTAMERHDRVVMLARNFSNIVDRAVEEKIQENADAISEEMSKEEPDRAELARLYERALLLNDSVKGRRAIMQDKTVQQIFKEMREEIESYMEMTPEELDENYGEGRGEYMLQAYQKVLDNWYELLSEACIIIENTENVRVVVNKHEYNTGTTTETVTGGTITDSSQDEDTNESEFDDDEDGDRVDGNGGWSFKVRFVDPRTSLSRGVKKVLANIKREGINGELEVDDLGNIRYIDAELAHAALINELSGMIDPNDFSVENDDGTYSFPALEKVAEKYPWANQIINALQAEPTLISSFYADFRKDFIPYWMQYFDENDGKWKTHAMNQAVALDSTKTSIINNYEQGTILDENSIYKGGRKLSTANAELGVNLANEILSLLREFDEDDYEELTEKVAKGLKMVGLNADAHVISNLLKSENGIVNLEKVVNAMKNIFSGIEGMSKDDHLIEAFSDDYNTIAQEVGLVSELDNVQSFRIEDKTYYSYSAPNYLDTMFKTFKSDERRDAYLQKQFGKYDWFKSQRTGQWRSEWLRLIETDEDVRAQMSLKELITIVDPINDPKRKHCEYVNWEPLQIKSAFIREYFSVGYNKGSKKQFAWYNIPIFSDSPVVKFIKFLRYTSDSQQTFKDKLLPLFNQLVKQELSRIKLVRERWEKGVSPITNFDITREEDIKDMKKGYKFHFFPELNTYNGGTFLSEAMRLREARDLEGLDNLINSAVSEIMRKNFESFLNTNFSDSSYKSLRGDLLNDGVITSESQFEDALEEYFWNQAYATSQIIELTTTDLAYYKDGTDFQKRYKEVYAAGTKLNINSQYGRKTERTIYLADQIVTSSGYQDIRRSLNRAVQLGHIQSFDRDNILNKFKDIDVADAQAYRSISSMRAVLDMMGAWTPEMQQAMDNFDPNNPKNKEGMGSWTMADFNIIWQTIKPFVFTQIEKPDGLGGSIKVPHQNKNSEFLLLSMYQMVANSMGRSPKLRAINRFMEGNNIDVIQFESAVKVGGQGTIDISYSEPKLSVWKMNHEKEWKEIEKAAKAAKTSDSDSDYSVFKAGNDYLLDHDMISQEEYNNRFEAIEPTEQEVYDLLESMSMQNGEFKPEVVHEIPYTDYVIQQPTPEHLIDCAPVVFGSQFRNLIISDMPDDPNFRVKVNGKELTKQQVLDLYQANIVENLLEDWGKVKGKFANIRSLQKAMLDAVKGNPKYGRDMLDALQIVEIVNPNTEKKQEVFNIPLDNPSTTIKIQELVTSMFKNAITKQSIKGGSCILVSDFGLTKELNILHGEDGSIQGIECYLPAYSKQFYEPFAVTKVDANGNEYQELDVTKMPMELRRIIGYRIPTEDKYSMAPLIIKGFLPQQNGSCIMLPADITRIAGSDFDVRLLLMSK